MVGPLYARYIPPEPSDEPQSIPPPRDPSGNSQTRKRKSRSLHGHTPHAKVHRVTGAEDIERARLYGNGLKSKTERTKKRKKANGVKNHEQSANADIEHQPIDSSFTRNPNATGLKPSNEPVKGVLTADGSITRKSRKKRSRHKEIEEEGTAISQRHAEDDKSDGREKKNVSKQSGFELPASCNRLKTGIFTDEKESTSDQVREREGVSGAEFQVLDNVPPNHFDAPKDKEGSRKKKRKKQHEEADPDEQAEESDIHHKSKKYKEIKSKYEKALKVTGKSQTLVPGGEKGGKLEKRHEPESELHGQYCGARDGNIMAEL